MKEPVTLDGAVNLTHLGVIHASGDDAAKFLHSQLTNDFDRLPLGRARLAGFCSAKGRLQASFVGWKDTDRSLRLIVSVGLLSATLKRLSMFVMRSQCKLRDASAEFNLRGLVGDSANGLVGDLEPWGIRETGAGTVIRLPDSAGLARAMLVEPSSVGLASTLPVITLDAWRWLEVQSGVALIESTTFEQFVPQMVNFELVGGVDFQKGCYPGQEVVARSQYRGSIKRRAFLFDTGALAQSGQEIYHSLDPQQPAGMVVNAAPRLHGKGSSVLAELKIAALNGGTLHLCTSDGPVLEHRELPYRVPIEPAAA